MEEDKDPKLLFCFLLWLASYLLGQASATCALQ
jgi:hypothetical protein